MKSLIKLLLWKFGVLSFYHRTRNRNTLTIIQLHRVLPDSSEAYQASNKEYALTVSEFEASLRFYRDYYNVISLGDVLRAVEEGGRLPKRALLISFDDGWQDNVDYAEPLLAKYGMRATVFLNVEAIEQPGNRWWQDALVEVYEKRPDDLRAFAEHPLFYNAGKALSSFSLDERLNKISGSLQYTPNERQMLTLAGVQTLNSEVWDVGSHGVTHVPLTYSTNSQQEYTESAAKISAWIGGGIRTFAYPHGRYDDRIVSEGRQAGYTSLMSSDARLNDTKRLTRVLGRIHVPSDSVRNSKGRISPMVMAYFLWLREFQAEK